MHTMVPYTVHVYCNSSYAAADDARVRLRGNIFKIYVTWNQCITMHTTY